MKLAQALIERKVLKHKIRDQIDLIQDSSTIQEGDPKPNIGSMLDDLAVLHLEHDKLDLGIRKANRTHDIEWLGEKMLLQDAIASRDLWKFRSKSYADLCGMGGGMYRGMRRQFRRSQSEVKFVELLDTELMMQLRDKLAGTAREIDAIIQAKNWGIEL